MVKEAQRPAFQSTPEAMVPILRSVGVERLTPDQMQQVFTDFGHHLQMALHPELGPSSLLAARSHLHPVERKTFDLQVPIGERALVFEIGGTNLGAAEVIRDDSPDGVTIISSVKREMTTREYPTSQEFFAKVIDVARKILPQDLPSHIGIIWSLPPKEVLPIDNGVDIISSAILPKELKIGGIDSATVGEQLLAALGVTDRSQIQLAVLNDTVAVALAGFGKVGEVIGTGKNDAIAITNETLHNELVNTESGGFSMVPQTSLTEKIDADSGQQGKYLAEKQISGLYVGRLFNEALNQLSSNHSIQATKPEHVDAHDLSAVLEGNTEVVSHLFTDMSPQDLSLIKEVAQTLVDRSAQIAGAITASLAMELPDTEVIVPIEGSFFNLTPGYKEAMQQVVDFLVTGKKVTLVGVEQSGIKGAAIAALTVGRESNRRDAH